jgi:lysozyme
VGRNLEGKGITRDESRYLLANDIRECDADLQRIFPGYLGFTQGRQWALTDMRFNLGPSRFRMFKNMIAAVNRGDWVAAGNEALDSRWAKQVQAERVETIIRQLKEGW